MQRRWLAMAFGAGCLIAVALVLWGRSDRSVSPHDDSERVADGAAPDYITPLADSPSATSLAEDSPATAATSAPVRLTVSVVDDAGNAVPGGYVLVSTIAEPPAGQNVFNYGDRVGQGQCDGEGRFEAELPGPGRYQVYVNTHMSLIGKEEVPGSGYLPPKSDGSVEFEVPSDTDAWEATITIPGSLGESITGTVVDLNGRPVAEARVLGYRAQDVDLGNRDVACDAEGRFLMYGLLRGETVSIRAQKEGVGFAARRDVTAGTSGVVIELDPPASVTGRVVDGDGAPMAGAEVGWTSRSRIDPQEEASFESEATADDQGRFRIEGIIWVEGSVLARVPGYSLGHTPVTAVLGGTTDGVEVVLTQGASVFGVVTAADGTPVAGVEVGLVQSLGDGFRFERSVTTDEVGRYALANLAFGRYDFGAEYAGALREVRAVHVPSTGNREENWIVGDGGVIEGRLLRNGRPVEGIVQVTTYPISSAMDFGSGSFETKMDISNPGAKGRVLVRTENGAFRFTGLAARTYYVVGMESAPGVLEIAEDDPMMHGGIVMMRDEDDMHLDGEKRLVEIRNSHSANPSAEVTVTSASTVHVDLNYSGGSLVEGAVTCDGAPVVDASLYLWVFDEETRRTYSTRTDASGTYRFENVSAGQGLLSIRARGLCGVAANYQGMSDAYRTEFAVDGRGTARMDIDLGQAGAVKGTVPAGLDGNTRIVLVREGVSIDRVLEDDVLGVAGMTRARYGNGGFVLAPVEAGTYWVYATDEQRNILTEAVPVEVRAGETTEVALTATE